METVNGSEQLRKRGAGLQSTGAEGRAWLEEYCVLDFEGPR